MQRLLPLLLLWLICASAVRAQTPAASPAASPPQALHTWKTIDGRSFQAALVRIKEPLIELRLPDGKGATFPIARLSAEDQAFLKNGAGQTTPPAAAASTPPPKSTPSATPAAATANPTRLPPEKRTWPPLVEVDSRAIEVKSISDTGEDGKYLYRSQAFEFTSEDKLAGSVMKEIARTFEATRSLVEALPWCIEPKPPAGQALYQAKFYVTRESYIAAGGPANSGGVYMTKDHVFRVPFPSLGLEMRGKTWFKNNDFKNDTLVHEITHQMMTDYLPFLPTWVIEGTAEYTEMIPYNAGRFITASHERGLKEYIKEGAKRGMTPAKISSVMAHMNMTTPQWHERADTGPAEQFQLYFTSCLLVYYFSHLDGDGKGTRFFKYIDKIREGREAWTAFFQDPRVKVHPDGSFNYPGDLPLPPQKRSDQYGLEQLPILLDGRTPEQMQQAVVDGFKKIGVRW